MATCPLCGGSQFQTFRQRPNEECAACKSKGRTRLLYATMQRLGILEPGRAVIHFAPEPILNKALHEVYSDSYWIADINRHHLKKHQGTPIVVDLCAPSKELRQLRFDVILHSHVLEHVPCNWALAFLQLHALLNDGGVHLFSIPMQSSRSREDLALDMSAEERVERFGQRDHIRTFGKNDFVAELHKLAELTGSKPVVALDWFSPDEREESQLGGNVFALVKSR